MTRGGWLAGRRSESVSGSSESATQRPSSYLNRSSNARRALLVPDEAPPLARGRAGLPLDRRARREQRAGVARVFRRDARRQRRRSACIPSARWCRTRRTACSCADRRRSARSAPRRANGSDSRLPQRAQRHTSRAAIRFGVFGPARVLQHASRRALLRRPRRRRSFRAACLRLVLIAALPVFSIVAHVRRTRRLARFERLGSVDEACVQGPSLL